MTNVQPIIQIGWLPAVIGIVSFLVTIGIAWGSLRTLVKHIGKTLDDEIKTDLKDVRERFSIVEDRVDTIWKDRLAPAHSPPQLNERGKNILETSGIKEIIDDKKTLLFQKIKTMGIKNPYDAESAILQIVKELPSHFPEIELGLKNGAFKAGANLDDVFLVAGVYLRNLIFNELGFSLEDLDKPK